jgi:hypothetical protein
MAHGSPAEIRPVSGESLLLTKLRHAHAVIVRVISGDQLKKVFLTDYILMW